MNELMQLLTSVTGQLNIIPIPKKFIDFLDGDINSSILLTQLIYWTPKSKNDGWVYKSYDMWKEEIGLSKYKIFKSANKLKDLNIIETKIKKVQGNPTVHYKLNEKVFIESFLNFLKTNNSLILSKETLQTKSQKLNEPIYTENTTENTTEITNINIIAEISKLKDRYNNKNLIDSAIDNFSLLRKSGKMSDNLILEQFRYWDKYPIQTVENSIAIYLKSHHTKGEAYLRGIIRGESKKPIDWYADLKESFNPITVPFNRGKLFDPDNHTYYGFETNRMSDERDFTIQLSDLKHFGINHFGHFSILEYLIATIFFNKKRNSNFELLKELMKLWNKEKVNYEKYRGKYK